MGGEGSIKQYYVAVGTPDAKLVTLIDLLQALHANKKIALALCCGSRDSLDRVLIALAATNKFKLFCVFSDMREDERDAVIQNFKACHVTSTSKTDAADSGPENVNVPEDTGHSAEGPSETTELEGHGEQTEENKPCVLVVTDAVLLRGTKQTIGLELIVNYDLPLRKDVFIRRISALFGSGRERRGGLHVVINFFLACEISEFQNLESFSNHPIEVMPMHVSDIFGDPSVHTVQK